MLGLKKDNHWTTLPPAGLWWVRVAGFFLLNGWEVKNPRGKVLDGTRSELIKLVAYNVAPIKKILKAGGWDESNTTQLLRVVYGESTTKASLTLLEQLIASKADETDKKERDLKKRYAIKLDEPQEDELAIQHDPVERLAELLRAALPLARGLYEDSGSNGDTRRAELRRAVGSHEYGELTFILGALKTATNFANAQQQSGGRRGVK